MIEAAERQLWDVAYWAQEGVGASWSQAQELAQALLDVAEQYDLPLENREFTEQVARGEHPDMG